MGAAGKSEICRLAVTLEIPVGVVAVLNPKAVWRWNSFPLPGTSAFALRLWTDWLKSTHILEDNGLYSESTDLNVNHISKNTLTVTHRLVFNQTTGCHGPAPLTHKINHHRCQLSLQEKSDLTKQWVWKCRNNTKTYNRSPGIRTYRKWCDGEYSLFRADSTGSSPPPSPAPGWMCGFQKDH